MQRAHRAWGELLGFGHWSKYRTPRHGGQEGELARRLVDAAHDPGEICDDGNQVFGAGCDFDDSSFSSLGPDTYNPADQSTGVGFGQSLGLNTGRPGVGDNSMRMFVR